MNRKFLTLYRFSLFQKLRAKSFLISTVLMIVFLVGFSNIERIIDWFSGDDPKIAVVSSLEAPIIPVLKDVGIKTKITEKDYSLKQARQVVDKGTYDAVALLSDDPYRVTLISASPEQELQTQLSAALKQVRDQTVITDADVDPALLASLAAPIDVKQELTSTGGKSEDELFAASALVYVLLFLMYFTIAIYGGMIVTEIANEKSSRVMELLISAASPIQHMLAKITSIATVSLIQLSLLVGVGYYSAQSSSLFDQLSLDSLSVKTIVYLFVFLLGYLLYATLLAALGSLVSRVEDAQQVTLPVIMLIVAAFTVSIFSLNAPTNQAVVILSFVPFFTPMLMFLRVMLTEVPVWQVALSLLLMGISIALALFVGTRFYRGGVLFYGSNPLKQLRRILGGRQ
ncbi:ABC transporter permease [Exiguobacterium sp. R-39]|uniref:ABC transporter permease n=1 Tax=Exiguobacterium sp. R-39 TaxID=3416708 RepID=UPI003CF7B895